jgi:integrase
MARHGDGLYLRGKDTWYLNCQINGKRYQIKLGKHISKSVAKELALVKRAQILKGEAGIGNKRKDCMFEKAAEEFLKWTVANKKPRTIRTYRQCLDHLTAFFSGKWLSQIHPFLLEKYKHQRHEKGVHVRVNRELAVLKTLFNNCRTWGLFEGDNPVSKIKLEKEPKRPDRFLEVEEEVRLLHAATDPFRDFLIIWINTGVRVNAEALTLQWTDVDLRRNLLTVQAAYAKNGRSRTIPLNSLAQAALQRLKAIATSPFVFAKLDGTPYKSTRRAFETTCRKANIQGLRVHDLRHTFASRLAMAGVGDRTLQALGGWATPMMVQRYAHLSSNHIAEAVERIVGNNSTTLFTTPLNSALVKVV